MVNGVSNDNRSRNTVMEREPTEPASHPTRAPTPQTDARPTARPARESTQLPGAEIGNITVPSYLAGDIRVLLALLSSDDGVESLEPLKDLAQQQKKLSLEREELRKLKKLYNEFSTTSEAGGPKSLTTEELTRVIDAGKKLGVDTSELEHLRSVAEKDGGVLWLELPKEQSQIQEQREAENQKVLDSIEDAMESRRDTTTTLNFQIQIAMQRHTTAMATASQIVGEVKRQNESVHIA